MKTKSRRVLLGFCAFVAVASAAFAHPGHDGHELTWDFRTGLGHPFSGWDHILAMTAVGWWAMQLGGRARWLIPGAFLSLLVLSATIGSGGMQQNLIEHGIAASLVVLGLIVATSLRLPDTAAAAVVGAFAVFHGLAHGAEIPANTGAFGYRIGFEAASVLLVGSGMLIGVGARRFGSFVHRIAGAVTVIAGVLLFGA